MDHSKIFRTGVITSKAFVSRELAISEDGSKTIPYVAFEVESLIPIGFGEIHKETTNVVLLGEEPVGVWKLMNPAPRAGDIVKVHYATSYVKGGVMCVRVTDSEQLELIQKSTHNESTCDALDVFRKMFEENQAKNRKGE